MAKRESYPDFEPEKGWYLYVPQETGQQPIVVGDIVQLWDEVTKSWVQLDKAHTPRWNKGQPYRIKGQTAFKAKTVTHFTAIPDAKVELYDYPPPAPTATLWDQYAMAAISGLTAVHNILTPDVVGRAGRIADLMLEERKKRQ